MTTSPILPTNPELAPVCAPRAGHRAGIARRATCGAEIHGDGFWHEVQRGESPLSIVGDYQGAVRCRLPFHAPGLLASNPEAFADRNDPPGRSTAHPRCQRSHRSGGGVAHPEFFLDGVPTSYTVVRGDSLSKIARTGDMRSTGSRSRGATCTHANLGVIGPDPNRLAIGQVLDIPGVKPAGIEQAYRSLLEIHQQPC